MNNRKAVALLLILLVLLFAVQCIRLQVPPQNLIGAAFCHQMASRSLQYGDKVFPICYRCMGLFLGIFSAGMFLKIYNKRVSVPNPFNYVLLALSLCFFGIDILNSTTFFNIDNYPDQTTTRMISGFMVGFIVPLFIIPIRDIFSGSGKEPAGKEYPQKALTALSLSLAFFALLSLKGKAAGFYLSLILCSITMPLAVSCLYEIIVRILFVMKQKEPEAFVPELIGACCAAAQITLLGSLHLRFMFIL